VSLPSSATPPRTARSVWPRAGVVAVIAAVGAVAIVALRTSSPEKRPGSDAGTSGATVHAAPEPAIALASDESVRVPLSPHDAPSPHEDRFAIANSPDTPRKASTRPHSANLPVAREAVLRLPHRLNAFDLPNAR